MRTAPTVRYELRPRAAESALRSANGGADTPTAPKMHSAAAAPPADAARRLDLRDFFAEGAISPSLRTSLMGRVRHFLHTGHWHKLDGSSLAAAGAASLTHQGWSAIERRAPEMAFDPAKGKVSPGSVEEAAVGFTAELAGVVEAPLSREVTGRAEFVGPSGALWDVKSPVSPPAGASWSFDAAHQVEKVRHDLSQDNGVILNLSACTHGDAELVLKSLRGGLTSAEQENVVVLRAEPVTVGR